MRARIVNAQGEELISFSANGGFGSAKICEFIEGEGTTVEDCFISTPGKIIQEQLTFELSTGQRTLIAVDEINEIINALLSQLAVQAISGAGGLLGLTGAPSGGGLSYLDRLDAERNNIDDDLLVDAGDTTDFEAAHQRIIDAIDRLEANSAQARAASGGCVTHRLPDSLDDIRQESITAIASSTALQDELTALEAAFEAERDPRLQNEYLPDISTKTSELATLEIEAITVRQDFDNNIRPDINAEQRILSQQISRCDDNSDPGEGG